MNAPMAVNAGEPKCRWLVPATFFYIILISFAVPYLEHRYGIQIRKTWIGALVVFPALPGILVFLGNSIKG